MTTATATVVFTDVEDSTSRRAQIGEAAADQLFLGLERSLAELVQRHRGRVLKTAGDGIMAAFDSASDAVGAAVDMQRAVGRRDDGLRVRVGVASGDVSWEGEDCFGLPVVVAARLQAAAAGGQILVSQVVRWLAGERCSAGFEAVGPLELKGLPDPVEAFAVTWIDDPVSEPSAVPLPAQLAVPADVAFVERDTEWLALEEQWRRVENGGRAVLLLGGEAGAGKTRLATEFARRCYASGAAVLFGGCDPDLVVPYQPWLQALDHLLRTLPVQDLAAELVADLIALAPLLPALDRVRPIDPRDTALDPDSERYRLFGAVDSLLAEASRRWPLVIVLDDLHWAAGQTLALLGRVARAGTGGRTLVVATFRDTGDELTDALAAMLADLRRVDGVVRLRVGGLDRDQVASLIANAAGQDVTGELDTVVASVAERSRGNAFFAGELWRHLVAAGVVRRVDGRWTIDRSITDAGVPDSVRDVVASRLGRLAFPVRRLAELVAVAGTRIDLQVLRAATDVPANERAASLDELVTADLLEVVERPRLLYRFTHALVRDTVESGIPPASRAGMHLRIAEALEAVHEADRRPLLAELAGHYAAAASLGTTGKAIYYGRQAADQALKSVALEEALTHLTSVLSLADGDSEVRAETLMDLANLEARFGRFDAMRRHFEESFEIARRLGDARLVAEAAIGFENAVHTPGLAGEPAIAAVETAMQLVGDTSGALRVRLEAALGRALTHAGRLAEADEVIEAAMAHAAELGDAEAMGAALESALIAATDPRRMIEHAEALRAIGTELRDPWRVAYSSINYLRAYMMLGDYDRVRAEVQRHIEIWKQGRYVLVLIQAVAYDLSLALAAGRFAEAEQAAERALALSEEHGDTDAAGVYGVQMFAIRRAQGRLDEVRSVLEAVSRRPDRRGVWRPGVAVLYAELGMVDEARAAFEELAADGFASVPRDSVWPGSASFLADVCIALRDTERAAILYRESAHLAGHNVMVGMTVCLGPADRWLGGLAWLSGRSVDANAHFESALRLARPGDADAWRAQCQYEWAIVRAADGDATGAASLAAEALDTARRLGMDALAARCADLAATATLDVVSPAPALPDGLSAREVEVLQLIAAGCSNREVGERLLISANTAANHVRAILQKTGSANRAEAATYAARNGLLSD